MSWSRHARSFLSMGSTLIKTIFLKNEDVPMRSFKRKLVALRIRKAAFTFYLLEIFVWHVGECKKRAREQIIPFAEIALYPLQYPARCIYSYIPTRPRCNKKIEIRNAPYMTSRNIHVVYLNRFSWKYNIE